MKCILAAELIKRLSRLENNFLLTGENVDDIIRAYGDDYYWDREKLDLVKVKKK